jgi:ABC-type sugar transport system permease subunit
MEQHNRVWRAVLLALPLAVFAALVVAPLLSSFYYSVTNWNGFSSNYVFVGLANFTRITTDRLFMQAAVNTAIWIAAAIALPTALGLALALLLDSKVAGARIFKSIFYLPICLSAVIVGQIWVWIYQPDWGLPSIICARIRGRSG